jgi:hypothetical protein
MVIIGMMLSQQREGCMGQNDAVLESPGTLHKLLSKPCGYLVEAKTKRENQECSPSHIAPLRKKPQC